MNEHRDTIGFKNCNPLNIRYSSRNNWRGQVGEHKGFCVFAHESWGFRAAYKLITNYISQGYNTIEKIVSRWAPPTENDTEAYIKYVAYETIIDRDQILTDCNIHDYWTKLMIIRAMARMESFREIDEQQINLYINYPEKYDK